MNEFTLGLREAKDDELESIIERTKLHLPLSFSIHSFLTAGIRLKLVDRSHTRIYLPVSEKLPFFIVITGTVSKRTRNNLTPFWDPNEISIQNAKTLLMSIPNWDWEKPVLFYQTPLPILDAINEIMLGEGGLGKGKQHVDLQYEIVYKLSPEDINEVTFNDDFFLSGLTEDYAPLIIKHWDYTIETMEGAQDYLKVLPSMAAFVKVDSNENGECHDQHLSKDKKIITGQYKPVSWAICRFSGEIGFSYTLPEYRRKGLCSALTLALAKEIIKMNITPYVTILGHNTASIKAHEKIGFRKYGTVGFPMYLEKGMTSWNDY